ncbi:MAG: hypothetical protein U9P14_03200, partial [Gemmatimonadota bacterium]|nr:hypothetical protein [Gemmatimonadota bacterium]
NGVYVRSTASSICNGRLVDAGQDWETDRWKGYRVKYAPGLPPSRITGNSAATLFADFGSADPGEYSIYMKWEYVAPTPLNIACYDPNGMNEVYNNEFIGLTTYEKTRHGDYGDSGEWATAIMFVGMKRGPAEPGKYSVYIHGNRFTSNDLFLNGYEEIDMNIRVEDNTFTLVKTPLVTKRPSRFRSILGPAFINRVKAGGNDFKE